MAADLTLTVSGYAPTYAVGSVVSITPAAYNTAGTEAALDLVPTAAPMNAGSLVWSYGGAEVGGDPTVIDLPVGATLGWTASYTLTQADVDAGFVEFTASVTGIDSTGPITATALPFRINRLNVVVYKGVAEGTYTLVGDVLNYNISITNNSSEAYTVTSVTDPMIPVLNGLPPLPFDLLTGVPLNLSGSYTVTQADVDAGVVENTVTVDGTAPDGVALTFTGFRSVNYLPPPPPTSVLKIYDDSLQEWRIVVPPSGIPIFADMASLEIGIPNPLHGSYAQILQPPSPLVMFIGSQWISVLGVLYGTSLGVGSMVTGPYTVAIGSGTQANGPGSVAMGAGAVANGSVAVGKAAVSSESSVAVGHGVVASRSSIAIGNVAVSTGDHSVAIGANVINGTDNLIQLGMGHQVVRLGRTTNDPEAYEYGEPGSLITVTPPIGDAALYIKTTGSSADNTGWKRLVTTANLVAMQESIDTLKTQVAALQARLGGRS